jgi:L-malate glycosyltransferase
MKIAFFLENIQFGGLDTFIINLLNSWDKNDELILICNSSHPGLNLLKGKLNNRVRVMGHYVPLTWDLDRYFNFPGFVLKIMKFVYFMIAIPIQVYLLKKFFKQNKFDKLMVVNGGYPGGDSCLSASIAWGKLYPCNKAWHNFHNLAYSKNDYTGIEKLKYFRSILIDMVLEKYVKGFISVSKSSINSLNIRNEFKNNKKEYIYNGINIDVDLDNTISIKEKFNLPKNAKVISVLGVYEPRKGQEFLIKVFQKIYEKDKNIYLFMFGKGESKYIEHLKELIGGNKNIFLEDYQEEIKQIYKGTDILAIPSQSLESFGYTAVEAMAYNIPIIATDIGGLPEVVEDNICGYIVKKDDIDGFIQKIIFLCREDSLREKFGINGDKRYEKLFRAKIMSNKYEKLIKWRV